MFLKNNIQLQILSFFFISGVLFSQYSWTVFQQSNGKFVHMKINDLTNVTQSIFGLDANMNRYGNISEENICGLCRQFLSEYALLLNINPG